MSRWLERLWPALHSRNVRLFMAGQAISLTGTWMQQIAMGWLVYRVTQSALALGLLAFLGQLPGVVVAPLGGVLADRANPHRIVLATQALAMGQAGLLAALVLVDRVDVVTLLVLTAVLGILSGIEQPARQVFLAGLVDEPHDVGSVIAVNSVVYDGARLMGPAVGGALVAFAGEAACFAANALSFVAVLAALLAMRLRPRPAVRHSEGVLRTLAEGVRYAFRFAPIRSLVLFVAFVAFVSTPYAVLAPVMADTVLAGGPRTLGILMGAPGVGALAAGFYLGARRTVLGLGRLVVLGTAVFGAGLLVFSQSRSVTLSAAVLVVAGFGLTVLMAASNTVLQTIVDEDKRGRVMSLYIVAFMATVPVGSLLAGALASRIGTPPTVAFGGALCILGALVLLAALPRLRVAARPVFTRLGLIPAAAPESVWRQCL